jgi:two-component system cell cycle response regulator DivK
LVVEDEPNNRLVVVKLLQVAGVRPQNIVEIEGDAATFLQGRPPNSVDLILLDLQLPDKDGYTILRELRADPALAGIPVVALTANVMRPDVERAQAAGFDGFIGKPIDGRRFPEWVRRLLAGEAVWTATS